MNQQESDRWARHPYDPPPESGSGPEYHAEMQYWLDRHPQEKLYSVGDRYLDHAGYTEPKERRMAYDDLPSVSSQKAAEKVPSKFLVTLEVTAAQLAELETTWDVKEVKVAGQTSYLPGHGPGCR